VQQGRHQQEPTFAPKTACVPAIVQKESPSFPRKRWPSAKVGEEVKELPVELQKVVNGERLPGAYIVKSSNSIVLVYTVSKGFPLDIPDQVCRDLIDSNRRNSKVKDIEQTCLPPLDAPKS